MCGVKRMAQPYPNPTSQHLSDIVQNYPLFEQLRGEVDAAFKPAKNTLSRSIRKNDVAISQLAAQYAEKFCDATSMPRSVKATPLLFGFEKFLKKLNKIKRAMLQIETVSSDQFERPSELALDEHEGAFLNE